jgi:DNA repair photolyase
LAPQNLVNELYPFSLNTSVGCLFSCRYCYLQTRFWPKQTKFGHEIRIKEWIPKQLDKELQKYRTLPQHLKRVQVNNSTEGYLPQAIRVMDEQLGRDLMREVLEVFLKHWHAGNKWMVHLVTKSHMILQHLDLIAEMRDQVQIELTITTLDKEKARILEGYAPSVDKRIKLIERFAKRGVFIRVMCMPFMGSESEAGEVRRVLFDHGARGFKHKSLNYFDEKEMLEGNQVLKNSKRDLIYHKLHIKSGEPFIAESGEEAFVSVLMPGGKKGKNYNDLNKESMTMVDWGYSEINDVDWKYIK